MNDRMWTATVIRLLALIKELLYVTSIVTTGVASRELQHRASEINWRRYADFKLRISRAPRMINTASWDKMGSSFVSEVRYASDQEGAPRSLPVKTPLLFGPPSRAAGIAAAI